MSEKIAYARATHREYFEYLDRLRESGIVNMYGASPYLSNAFGLVEREARAILTAWMDSFGKDGANEHA